MTCGTGLVQGGLTLGVGLVHAGAHFSDQHLDDIYVATCACKVQRSIAVLVYTALAVDNTGADSASDSVREALNVAKIARFARFDQHLAALLERQLRYHVLIHAFSVVN